MTFNDAVSLHFSILILKLNKKEEIILYFSDLFNFENELFFLSWTLKLALNHSTPPSHPPHSTTNFSKTLRLRDYGGQPWCWKTHSEWRQSLMEDDLWCKTTFNGRQPLMDPKFFLTQHFFRPNIFFRLNILIGPNVFWTQIFFWPEIFLDQHSSLDPKFFHTQNFFQT